MVRKKCYPKHFCWFIILINAGKLYCKNYSITDLVFQEHTSQIQDFFNIFSTSVQFQDFSGPGKIQVQISGLLRTRGNGNPVDVIQQRATTRSRLCTVLRMTETQFKTMHSYDWQQDRPYQQHVMADSWDFRRSFTRIPAEIPAVEECWLLTARCSTKTPSVVSIHWPTGTTNFLSVVNIHVQHIRNQTSDVTRGWALNRVHNWRRPLDRLQ